MVAVLERQNPRLQCRAAASILEPKYLPSISGDLAAASGFRPRLRAARRRDHLCRAQLGHLVIDCCGTGLADLGRQWGGRGDSVTLGRERQVVCSGQDRRNQGKVWFPTEVYSTSGQHEPARPLEFGSLGLQMKSRSLLAICTNIVGSNACACNSGDSGDGGKCTLNSQPAWRSQRWEGKEADAGDAQHRRSRPTLPSRLWRCSNGQVVS